MMKLAKTSSLSTNPVMDRNLSMEMVRVTERAAVAAANWRGKGDEQSADQAAVEAMSEELATLAFRGRVVVGEGVEGEAARLFIGEQIGTGYGPEVDIAADPLEGTTLCAKNLYDSLCVLAVTERGGLLQVPSVYMEKIAIGSYYPEGLIDIRASATDNVKAVANARKVPLSEVTSCVLDRPRHAGLIEELRTAGVGVTLLGDGDIASVIHAANTEESGIDIYLGSGGAPEGVLAAAALRCMGGQMQARLILNSQDHILRAKQHGITDMSKIYHVSDMVGGDVIFAATGVTEGSLVGGVKIRESYIETQSVVMRSWSKTSRWIKARHAR